ncbi:hypothetical protein BU26DRAFT_83346 [Trematosphaeria pertusa]|uniref:DUF1254 domain-containing protein n=1 Tax=Trematosphaeria pertusa TaxID=390896 RepID=A0A6A6I2E3_9PLEO|nr:uncharacterized protein BU26DRAFT_83346 [Trematosphaeria pertusa]KAF2244644.1 hypothetical protein BU26DRAFT_83346 [Trematosphaeria pertusa]
MGYTDLSKEGVLFTFGPPHDDRYYSFTYYDLYGNNPFNLASTFTSTPGMVWAQQVTSQTVGFRPYRCQRTCIRRLIGRVIGCWLRKGEESSRLRLGGMDPRRSWRGMRIRSWRKLRLL